MSLPVNLQRSPAIRNHTNKYMYHMRIAIIFCLLHLSTLALLNAQSHGDYVSGQLIVQIEEDRLAGLLEDLAQIDGRRTGLARSKFLSKAMNAWLLTFDESSWDSERMLSAVRRHPDVSLAQFNHYVFLRKTPNDASYASQWHHNNDGSQGVAGSDIKSESAWEVTTGGVTASGDTIVICMVDDAIDLDHEDFQGNLWVNHGEIPDNGIDDDDNGYIDDIYGWNAGNDNGNVDASNFNGHGTQVAGMAGARGDNETGVSGVNWTTKIMTVVYGNSNLESEVIEGYAYPLWFRKRYNETDGAEGAFVVVTNSSWGINFGQPDDSPLWCAFYDSLGVHGILSCGATANLNIDIDVEGDLPTGCPSEYMVAVTSTNINNQKSGFSAFGLTTIDLGAPGDNVFTTRINNNYGSASGTSFASPTVAGAIALLYASPCAGLSDLAKTDPSGAALLARDMIYAGVDPIASLEGLSATGGRLNISNSLMLSLQACASCPSPLGLDAEAGQTSATLSWESADSVTWLVVWRETGNPEWDTLTTPIASLLLDSLTHCTNYEFQVASLCAGGDTSAFSFPLTFSTTGCCVAPEELAVVDASGTPTLVWTMPDTALGFLIELTPADTNGQTFFSTLSQSLGLDIADCESYTATVQALCPLGDTSEVSEPLVFSSGNCGPCTSLNYCPSEGTNTDFEWIESVSLNTLLNVSGPDGGYAFFQNNGTELESGQTYTLTVEPGFDGFAFSETFLAWIDYNQNGQFDLPFEEILNVPSNAAVSVDFTVPPAALPGTTRMRVSMIFSGDLNPCNPSFTYGEVEDYCITISGDPDGCKPPAGLMVDFAGIFAAELVWDQADFSEYLLQYREIGSPDWVDAGLVTSPYTADGLDNCTEYEFRLATICVSGDTSAWSFPATFATIGCCPAPSMLNEVLVIDSALVVNWTGSPADDTGYLIDISPATNAGDSVFLSETTFLAIEQLEPCTEYTLTVRSLCVVGDTVGPSAPLTVRTKGCGACLDNEYCSANGINPNSEWIERVAIKDIDNVSGNNGGYVLFEDQTTTLVQDSAYTIELEPGFNNFSYNEYFRVWIDYDQDGVFNTVTELVYDQGAASPDPVSGTFTIPEDAILGETRMRVAMRFASAPNPCGTFSFGEVEDYCVIIGPKFIPCSPPLDLAVIDSSQSSLLVDWSAATESTIGFNLQVKRSDESEWDEYSTTSDLYLLEGLELCTLYDIRVRSICETDISGYSDTLTFQTTGCPVVSTREPATSLSGIKVYPNPFSSQLIVKFDLAERENVRIQMTDLTGRVVHSVSPGLLPSGSHLMDVSPDGTLPAGTYFFILQTPTHRTVERVVRIDR